MPETGDSRPQGLVDAELLDRMANDLGIPCDIAIVDGTSYRVELDCGRAKGLGLNPWDAMKSALDALKTRGTKYGQQAEQLEKMLTGARL